MLGKKYNKKANLWVRFFIRRTVKNPNAHHNGQSQAEQTGQVTHRLPQFKRLSGMHATRCYAS
ncbi:MAG: hypothetical protein ACRCUZ_16770, partial [Shewanella sp.]